MTPFDLESVVARTGHERFRWLTSDANPDVAHREAYRSLVAHMAAGGTPTPSARRPASEPDPPLVPLSVVRRVQKIGHGNCLYATKCGCAGGGARCHHLGRVVTIRDCVRCLGLIPEEAVIHAES